jgi:hypothetical protein
MHHVLLTFSCEHAKNAGKTTGRAAHDPTQLESPFDFDRLEAGVAGSTAL